MDQATGRRTGWELARTELEQVFAELDLAQYRDFRGALASSPGRIFFSGQGRSGLSAQMAAMRFMHLGRRSHFVGEATAPSVRAGDQLVLVSGSGQTPVSVGFARIARAEQAEVLLVTHQEVSPLRELADHTIVLPAAHSEQFGGTLFEQSALIVLDAVLWDLMSDVGTAPEAMLHNHTNLQ